MSEKLLRVWLNVLARFEPAESGQTTAEYARVRTQFDRLIGFFQAVKHPIVNVMIDVDRARSLTYAAACAIRQRPPSHRQPA